MGLIETAHDKEAPETDCAHAARTWLVYRDHVETPSNYEARVPIEH